MLHARRPPMQPLPCSQCCLMQHPQAHKPEQPRVKAETVLRHGPKLIQQEVGHVHGQRTANCATCVQDSRGHQHDPEPRVMLQPGIQTPQHHQAAHLPPLEESTCTNSQFPFCVFCLCRFLVPYVCCGALLNVSSKTGAVHKGPLPSPTLLSGFWQSLLQPMRQPCVQRPHPTGSASACHFRWHLAQHLCCRASPLAPVMHPAAPTYHQHINPPSPFLYSNACVPITLTMLPRTPGTANTGLVIDQSASNSYCR